MDTNKIMKRIYIGKFNLNGWAFVCPNCSNIQGNPEDHKYNMVKFDIGDTEKECSNCGVILYIKPLEK